MSNPTGPINVNEYISNLANESEIPSDSKPIHLAEQYHIGSALVDLMAGFEEHGYDRRMIVQIFEATLFIEKISILKQIGIIAGGGRGSMPPGLMDIMNEMGIN